MVRIAPVVALGCLLGSCASQPEVRQTDNRPPVACDETSWNVRLLKAEAGLGMMVGHSYIQPYLLDLKVRVNSPPGAWLVVGVWSFPAHVHDVTRMKPEAPGATAPQVWLFRGDGHAVEARWLQRPGDAIVRNVWTVARRRGLAVALIRLRLDGLSPHEWVLRGGSSSHRLIDVDQAASVKLQPVCTTLLDLDRPDGDAAGGT
jgi:hypothetical protein